jgi:hypothetical protein
MESILDELMRSLQSTGGIDQMSRSTGMEQGDVTKVLSGALPALMAGLSRSAARTDGATGLLAVLDRDHDGSVMDDVAGYLAGAGAAAAGTGILRHTLGERQGRVETALSRSTGVDQGSVSQILAMAAPLVLGYLGRQRQNQNLDAAGLLGLLDREQQVVQQRSPQAANMLNQLLDADGDGSIMDEVAEMGSSLLGSLFKQP